jgi:hypothetical protein
MKRGGHWWFDGVIRFATGLDIDDDLERTVEAIEQPAEGVQPALTVIVCGARKPEPSGFDDRLVGRALPSLRRPAMDHSNRYELLDSDHAATATGSTTGSLTIAV